MKRGLPKGNGLWPLSQIVRLPIIGMPTVCPTAGRWKEAIPIYQKAIRLNPIGSSIMFSNLGNCYAMDNRFEEAVSAWKQAILLSPDYIYPHISLAAVYIRRGREKEARAEAAEVLRINPKFTLDSYAKTLPFEDQSLIDRIIGALRKAGLK